MRVQSATIALYAEVELGSRLMTIVGAGAEVFGTPSVPARVRTYLALQLRYPEAEANHEHLVTFTLRGTDLRPVGRPVDVRFVPALTPLHAPGWEALFSIAGPMSFTVDALGTYSIGIDLTGVHAAEIPFRVAELAPGGD